MRRKWKGYFTIEASFIMPVVLVLYLMIILAALFLYCRCVISQDNFLLGMRAARFTWGEEGYGEVFYGDCGKNAWNAEQYVQTRLAQRKRYYPLYPTESGVCRISEGCVLVETGQKGSRDKIAKNVQALNPVNIIREGRKNQSD